MCGVIGILKKKEDACNDAIAVLKKLEYRGYDSAGIGILDTNNNIIIQKVVGKIANLETKIKNTNTLFQSNIAIGHTRWATHGKVSEENSHPHFTDKVAVVHNGIIENYKELKNNLISAGYKFKTETDTEVIAVLLTYWLDIGANYEEAFAKTINELQGNFAIIALFDGIRIVAFAKNNSPLIIGKTKDDDFYICSDVNAVGKFIDMEHQLCDGEFGFIKNNTCEVKCKDGKNKNFIWSPVSKENIINDLGKFETFMMKEIVEQPLVIGGIINHYFDIKNKIYFKFPDFDFSLKTLKEINIVACGTSAYAGLTASYYFEKYAKVEVKLHIASEFCTRSFNFRKGGVFLFISQSGETADTISALKKAKANNQHIISLVNVKNSTIDKLSNSTLYCQAGQEIGVASTKAFTAQLSILIMFATRIGLKKHLIHRAEGRTLVETLLTTSENMLKVLSLKEEIDKIAEKIYKSKHIMLIGRGISYGIATEGSLKIKELAYIPTTSIPAGELKHGTIALIDKETPVIVVGIPDETFKKTCSNIEEVITREGQVYLLSNQFGVEMFKNRIAGAIQLPNCHNFISPLLYVIVLQLMAYFIAKKLERNIDKPRNLAKSVTVE